MEICSRFTGMERKDGAFLLHTDNADIKVCFVTDEIVRVRASFDHELAEESYILMTTAWKDRMDDLFQGERTRVEPFAAEVTEDEKQVTFAAGKVTLVVDKTPLTSGCSPPMAPSCTAPFPATPSSRTLTTVSWPTAG